jgi:Zn ribbon nucleic-acid-binding protein
VARGKTTRQWQRLLLHVVPKGLCHKCQQETSLVWLSLSGLPLTNCYCLDHFQEQADKALNELEKPLEQQR